MASNLPPIRTPMNEYRRDGHAQRVTEQRRSHTSTADQSARTAYASWTGTTHHTGRPVESSTGQKRKLDALHGQVPLKSDRPGGLVPPSIPTFGGSLTPLATTSSTNLLQPQIRLSKASLFGLHGSTPYAGGESDHDLSDDLSDDQDQEEDVDEEAAHAQLGTRLVFEYDGKVVKLDSEADLTRWHEERKRRWPSNSRVAEKQAERQKTGAERRRLLEAAYALRQPGFKFREPLRRGPWTNDSSIDATKSGPPEHSKPPVEKSSRSNSASLPGMALYDSEDSIDDEKETQPTGSDSLGPRLAQVESIQEGMADLDDDNDAPEQLSTKSVAAKQQEPEQRACKYFFHNGKCKEGDDCAYRHDAQLDRPVVTLSAAQRRQQLAKSRKQPQPDTKKGIHQLLVDQERESADRLALKVIKYLGGIGFFEP